ncbi:hypothetical protein Z052_02035 [Halorubrum sp. C191]|uniref:hypothetical protein n=1 Tax=Halorubrum sp. C191 TaxID=1383842 RepID=UPI000C085023|nr:hypothetical protein [Halorubrum sp. C191]PHQ43942.1 hypothetical protein Z052_02035 [Halorubrum sp. C191]
MTRHRHTLNRPHRAVIKRRSQTGTNEIGEPLYETQVVAEDVPCSFKSESTEFIREDSGEEVQRPASARFAPDVDLREGDTVEIDAAPTAFEVRGIEENRMPRFGTVASIRATLNPVD